MTFALTRVKAYGIEASEPLQKINVQRVELDITGANTDVAYDVGDVTAGSLGTFWTAVSGTEPGTTALKAFRDIAIIAKCFLWVGGLGLTGKSQISGTGGGTTYLDSAVYAGGSATPTLTVTGLAAADVILSATQRVKNANSLPLLGWTDGSRTANQLDVAYSADPGATGVVRVAIQKAAAAVTPVAGQYSVTLDATVTTLPNILFASGNAPTVAYLVFEWELKDGIMPIEVDVSA